MLIAPLLIQAFSRRYFILQAKLSHPFHSIPQSITFEFETMSTRMLCNLASRRTVDRNIARFYNRKRVSPPSGAAMRCSRTYHRSTENELMHQGNDQRRFSVQGISQWGFNSRALDLVELQLRKQQLMHRRSSSSVLDGSEELDLLFHMRGKQHFPDLSMEEIQELDAFLNSKMDGTSTQIFKKQVPSTMGVVERFQAWAALAY
jgi:hypothetical protein